MDTKGEKNLSNRGALPISIPNGKAIPQPIIIAINALNVLAAKWCQNSVVSRAARNACIASSGKGRTFWDSRIARPFHIRQTTRIVIEYGTAMRLINFTSISLFYVEWIESVRNMYWIAGRQYLQTLDYRIFHVWMPESRKE